ncbi:MAG: Holliday junction resolvase RecU, partial [Bacilli bacterium]
SCWMNNINYKNRGMFLEGLINSTNLYYLNKDVALIYKKPTPIKVLKVEYKSAIISKAVYERISTLDYNGLYRGKYIEFDCKECNSKTSFPISNILKHQVNSIRGVLRHKGIVFILIYMNRRYFLLEGSTLIGYIDSNKKSISYEEIVKTAHEIKEGLNPSLDYLKVIDKIVFEGEMNEKDN